MEYKLKVKDIEICNIINEDKIIPMLKKAKEIQGKDGLARIIAIIKNHKEWSELYSKIDPLREEKILEKIRQFIESEKVFISFPISMPINNQKPMRYVIKYSVVDEMGTIQEYELPIDGYVTNIKQKTPKIQFQWDPDKIPRSGIETVIVLPYKYYLDYRQGDNVYITALSDKDCKEGHDGNTNT